MAQIRNKTVHEALQYVAEHPQPSTQDPIDMPIWELISREVFHVANHPNKSVRGSLARATRAQKILLNRLVGRRRPGTHPAQANTEGIDFTDLTQAVLEAENPAEPGTEEQSDDQ